MEYIQIALVMITLSTALKIWAIFQDNQLTHHYNESLTVFLLLLAHYGFYMTNIILWSFFWGCLDWIYLLFVFLLNGKWFILLITVAEIILYFIKEKNESEINCLKMFSMLRNKLVMTQQIYMQYLQNSFNKVAELL